MTSSWGEMGIGNKKKYGVIIDKKGLFDYYSFYNIFAKFFKSYKYFYNELEYSTKTTLPQGKEVVIVVLGKRKITDYIKFYIEVRIEIRGGKNLNIQSHKKQRGHVIARFKAYYEKDYMNKWPIKFFQKIYEDHIIKQKILDYEGKLWAEANNLITKTKKSLGLMPRK